MCPNSVSPLPETLKMPTTFPAVCHVMGMCQRSCRKSSPKPSGREWPCEALSNASLRTCKGSTSWGLESELCRLQSRFATDAGGHFNDTQVQRLWGHGLISVNFLICPGRMPCCDGRVCQPCVWLGNHRLHPDSRETRASAFRVKPTAC